MSIDVFPSLTLATLTSPLPLAQGGTGAVTAADARTNLGLGTLAVQNANAVAITGGQISIGGHAATGVLDVQGSVAASDVADNYFSIRVWPVVPSGAGGVQPLRIEAPTGAGIGAGSGFWGIVVPDVSASFGSVRAMYSAISAGANRYNIQAQGTAQNYFAGNVGCGNATPTYPLDVTGHTRMNGVLALRGTPTANITLMNRYDPGLGHIGAQFQPLTEVVNAWAIVFANASGGNVGTIALTATTTTYNTTSDVRLKHSIETLVGALDAIRLLHPVRFRWNADDSIGHGFLAHELQAILPDAVSGEPDAVNADGSVKPQQVDASKIVVWLCGAVQELATRLQTLEEQLGI